jgi:hypothetical protein
MSTIVLQSKSGPDSKLHLEIPVDQPDTEFDVEIVVRPKTPENRGWPPGYFDLFGSIDDETFMLHPQPPMPPSLEIE